MGAGPGLSRETRLGGYVDTTILRSLERRVKGAFKAILTSAAEADVNLTTRMDFDVSAELTSIF